MVCELLDVVNQVEDILAVMQVAGPGAALLGHSSGGVFALETALRTKIETLILYEPAIRYGTAIPAFLRDTIDVLNAALPDALVLERPGQGHTANIAAAALEGSPSEQGPELLAAGLAVFLIS